MTDAQTETRLHEMSVKQGEGESQAGRAVTLPQRGHGHTCPKPFPGYLGTQVTGDRLQGQVPVPPRGHLAQDSGHSC